MGADRNYRGRRPYSDCRPGSRSGDHPGGAAPFRSGNRPLLAESAFDNPQEKIGPDILTRIHFAEKETGLRELNVNQDFMNRFSAAKFLPHTNTKLFPSVTVVQKRK